MGDFNLQPPTEAPLATLSPLPGGGLNQDLLQRISSRQPSSTRPFQARWEKLFTDMTEVRFSQCTR